MVSEKSEAPALTPAQRKEIRKLLEAIERDWWEVLSDGGHRTMAIPSKASQDFLVHSRRDMRRALDMIDALDATAENPEGDCLPATLKNRAKQLSRAGRYYDARLMESAWVYLEQYRDETVPELGKENARLLDVLKTIREAGQNDDRTSQWMQRWAAWGVEPHEWPKPSDQPHLP